MNSLIDPAIAYEIITFFMIILLIIIWRAMIALVNNYLEDPANRDKKRSFEKSIDDIIDNIKNLFRRP